jgi:exopolysaccharide biosynthesis polyprenyl glycosylphosphotransferase
MDRYQYFVSGLKVLDLVVMASCFILSAVLVAPGLDVATIREFMGLRISLGNFILFGAFAVLWHLLFSAFGLYGDSLLWNGYRTAIDVLKATSIGTCAIVALAVPFKISFVDARFLLIFWTSVSFLSFCSRLIARELLVRYNRHEENLRRILIVGANTRAVHLARQIETKQELGCRVIGFIDDTAIHAPDFGEFGYQLVAEYKDLSDYLGKTAMDEVLVCLPIKSRSEDISDVVSVCEEQGIAVGILRDLFRWPMATSTVRQFGEQTIITVHPHAIDGSHAATKRAFDVLLSAILIILFLPVFIITTLLIKLVSPGPVIFAHERIGLNKKRFRMLKFRTMVPQAAQQQAALEHFNEAAGPVFKIKDDPRITPVGKFLRKTSIDELPQLINVIKGEMSLVGPRPLPLRDYEGFSKDWHRRRVSVRPGITGLWQVHGRDHSSFDEWMKLDLEYIDRWSLMLDFEVMLKTIPAVLRGSGQ